MPGFELMGREELDAVKNLFDANGGVLFAHGFDGIRKGIFKVREFEKAFALKMDIPYAQAVSSGTAAVYVALRALGIRPGDEVLIPAWTFVATCEAVMVLGAQPVIVDIDESLNMDPEDLRRKITPKSKAVIPVHMMGSACDMGRILEIARKHKLLVMEDTAQAFGATYQGHWLGTIGDAGSYSFDFGKAITTGEGGMVVTANEETFRYAREYHDHGHEYNTSVPRGEDTRRIWGFNFRMNEIQGAIGLAQLGKAEDILRRQRSLKRKLVSLLKNRIPPLRFRKHHDQMGEAADTLVVRLGDQKKAVAVANELKRGGIGTKLLPEAINWHFAGTWKHMLSETSLYNNLDLEKAFRRSGNILRSCVALGVSLRWTDADLERVAEKLCTAVETCCNLEKLTV